MIVYRDYSLRKRIPTEERKKSSKKSTKTESDARLQCLEIDNNEPLSAKEWESMSFVLSEAKGIAWFQILPTG